MSCFAADCNHSFGQSGCKLLRFPTNFEERKRWIKAVRRLDKDPNESSRICSCHFVDGNRENGPTIFSWNSKGVLPPVPLKKKLKPAEKVKTNSKKKKSNRSINKDRNNEVIPVNNNVEEGNAALLTQNDNLRKEVEKLKKQPFGMHCIEKDEKLFSYYTGLSKDAFKAVLDSCSKSPLRFFYGWKVDSLDLQDQLLIMLMKLRLNLDYLDLSVRFNTTEDTISNIVLTFISTLHEVLCAHMLDEALPEGNNVTCRMIVGYTEFDTVIPLRAVEEEKSNKKHKNSLKGLIAIDANGVITHCSRLYSAITSDKVIMRRSGIVSKYKNTELILIDEGPVSDSVLTADDLEAYARTIRRLRYFGILHFIPKPLFVHSSKIFQLCGALTNLMNPELKQVEKPDYSASLDVEEERLGDCDNFVDCTKFEIKEEVDLGVESTVHIDDFDDIYCKSEPEEAEDEVIMEYDLEIDEIV